MILNGQVNVVVRNEVINQWEWAHNIYEALI